MKKNGIILMIIGIILIIISILFFVNKDNNKINSNEVELNIPWSVEYQKKGNISEEYKKYNSDSYQKCIIDQASNVYYIIPKDAYLNFLSNDTAKYSNDEINITINNYIKVDTEVESIISSTKSDDTIEILKYEEKNGNILLLEKKYVREGYVEKLNLFLKTYGTNYYHLTYIIKNMSFSDEFINEIINMEKYKDKNNYTNQDGKINLYLHTNEKETFELNYDSTKYFSALYYQGYIYSFKVDKDSNELINLYFNYDKSGVDESINTMYTINSSEKTKINNYDVWLYKTAYKDVEYVDYLIMIDDNTKLRINYPKSIEDKVDISDFLNFVYE